MFGASDEIKILFAGQRTIGGVGIDGKAVQIFLAFRAVRRSPPFLEGAMQVLGNGAEISAFSTFSLSWALKVRGELLPHCAGCLLRS
ncbi:MAG: hypothetical protein R3B95_08015 [Nitrospirales bacterium]|nr:hypothetical protein [Nitrospirales bacterium]